MKRTKIMVLGAAILMVMLTGCQNAKKEESAGDTGVITTEKSDSAAEESIEPKVVIQVAHNQTSMENPYVIATKKFKEELERLSGGEMTAVLNHGTLGESDSELIEKLDMGAVDLVVVSPGFMTSIGINEIDIFSLPYLFDSFEHWEAAVDGEFGQRMRQFVQERTDNKFRIMDYWTASVRDYYGKKKVVKPEDLKGMTLRGKSSPVLQEFWKQCGAIPTNVAWGELYQALAQGVVDCAENDYTSFRLKEHHKTENGKYISETHHDFTTCLFLTTGDYYDNLTEEQKTWFQEACDLATKENREVTYRMFEESKQIVINDGAIVTDFEDVDIDAFKAIAIPIQDKFAAENGMEDYLELVRSAKK